MWRWKKKNSWVGATFWYHWVADDSRIPKMPAINPLQALVHPQTQKNILHGLSIPNPNFSKFAFLGKYICRLGCVDFNLPSNSWVSLLQKSEFAVLVLGFEKLGLGLDNCGRTTKNAYYCRIYSLWAPTICVVFSKRVRPENSWPLESWHLMNNPFVYVKCRVCLSLFK
jgi:hypothetical protein